MLDQELSVGIGATTRELEGSMTEQRWSRIVRVVVGGLLLLEAIAMLILAVFVSIIGSLAGALAFGVSGGSATDEQLAQGFAVIAVSIASPFVVASVLAVGGVLLLLRRGSSAVIAAGGFAIAAQIAYHPFFQAGFHAVELLPGVLHVLTIAVGFACVPARSLPTAARAS